MRPQNASKKAAQSHPKHARKKHPKKQLEIMPKNIIEFVARDRRTHLVFCVWVRAFACGDSLQISCRIFDIFCDFKKISSNSARLVEVAKKAGCKNSLLMHSEKEIPFLDIANSKIIGISSGASAPEELVQNLIKKIKILFLPIKH